MFTEEILKKYADVMIWGLTTARKTTGGEGAEYKKGDIILLRYQLDSLGLAEIVYRKLLEKEFHVITKMSVTPKMEFDFFDTANEDQLKFLGPWEKLMVKNLNGLMALLAPASLTHLASIDPKKFAVSSLAGKPIMEIRDKREQKGEFGWTLCMMPTFALAEQAKIPLIDYGQEIIKACYLDKDDPVQEWEKLYKEVSAIKTWLNNLSPQIDYIHIESKSGNLDLKVTLGEKRQWLGVSGHNIPSFEIFTSPDWRGTKGIYYANMPSFKNGNYVEGVKLGFKDGKVTEVIADKGKEFLQKTLEMDAGAKRIGELSFTDKRFSPIRQFMANTLFDENIGGEFGNCHIAIGNSYLDTCSEKNIKWTKALQRKMGFNESSLHWDLINTEDKTATAYLKSGEKIVIYENGMFKNE